MKVQQVFTKRGKSIIAATGIAAVVMFNGLGGGIASANQSPPVVCEFAPASQSGTGVVTGSSESGTTTTSLPTGDGTVTTIPGSPAEAGSATSSTAGGNTEVMPPDTQVESGTFNVTQSCELQSSAPSQTVSVDVCVSGNDIVVTSLSPTEETIPSTGGEAAPGTGAGANATAVQGNPDAPQSTASGTASGGTVETGTLEVTQAENGVVTTIDDAPGVVISEGEVAGIAVGSSSSTCVSVTVTDGSTSIDITTGAGAAGQSGGANEPSAGQSATGEVVPTQPGVTNGAPTQPGTQTTPPIDPNATPPAPGQ